MDRGAGWATVHGGFKELDQTEHTHTHTHTHPDILQIAAIEINFRIHY